MQCLTILPQPGVTPRTCGGTPRFLKSSRIIPNCIGGTFNQFYGDVFRGGKVAQRYKELLRLRLSTLHGCRFCNQGNRLDALEAGLTEAQIAAFESPESGAVYAGRAGRTGAGD